MSVGFRVRVRVRVRVKVLGGRLRVSVRGGLVIGFKVCVSV